MENRFTNRLKQLLEVIPNMLLQLPEDEFSAKANADIWSKKQILGHLIDSAANNHQRFIRVQYESALTIVYDQNKWNALNHYQQLDSKHIIHLWTLYNKHLLEVIKRIPAENLTGECNTGDDKPLTLQFLIDDYVVHMEHHLKQILAYSI
jgi:hypothetical protein